MISRTTTHIINAVCYNSKVKYFTCILQWENEIDSPPPTPQQHFMNNFCPSNIKETNYTKSGTVCIHLFQKRLTWFNSEYHDQKEFWAFKKFQYNQANTLRNLNSRWIRNIYFSANCFYSKFITSHSSLRSWYLFTIAAGQPFMN